ncbi:MAG: Fe-S cluster assembly protein SufD [Armatimonadota bacterium]|nr:Fe-S cluster assembly protein SufD [Armatimonadota bacterium]MDR7437665.1 Fe-S cluster assembly protein SufD [Armatimonadota bacterium]MDR7471669.1 Fe-S cluster assembly protein SufD [Armatimonadota bacterium]MDR7507948.1 Fe-S cluster assembly protein SufD [Armatimonadota bacterium]MDR7509807.1 Fe-S cluster assembly protein SufD [Armatimonadota bacterium]
MGERTTPVIPVARDAILSLAARLDEPAWLREARLAAWDLLGSLPPPSPTDEEWRRTDPGILSLDGLHLGGPEPSGPLPAALEDVLGRWPSPAAVLVYRNSRLVRADLSPDLAARGVVAADLSAAAHAHADLVRRWLMTEAVRPQEGYVTALHAAARTGGPALVVPDGVEVAEPVLVATWIDGDRLALAPHLLVVAGRGSRVTVMAATGSGAGEWAALALPVAEVILGDGAQVRLVTLHVAGPHVREVGILRAVLGRDSTLHTLQAALGGRVLKMRVESILAGPGASAEMLGVVFGDDGQHVDIRTLQEHRAPHTLSDLLFKNAVRDRAHSIFSGLIRVHYGAQKTNAFQANRNLILSEGAKADSIPNLEIMANDLRCTHGSATSRLSEDHLFYLMSRGLTRSQAVRMVVEGFFAEVLDRVPLAPVRDLLAERIGAKMAT